MPPRTFTGMQFLRTTAQTTSIQRYTMIKCVALISVLVALGEAQRPPFAGTYRPYPQVLPRFLDEQASTATVVDRLGESTSSTGIPATVSTTSTERYQSIPGADSDPEWVRMVASWPREKQPFGFINRVAIQQHLNPATQARVLRPEVGARSFFAGK